jgi:AcrR family transcriptional regulator
VKKGVQNTSTAEIAREAGTAAGTLFLYFPTKQDLIDELILKFGKSQAETIQALLEPSLSARETFLTIWQSSIHWFLDNMDAYEYVRQVRDSGMVSASIVQESIKFFGFYYEAIQKGLREASIKPYPPELIGAFLYQDIIAIMEILKPQPDVVKQEELIQLGFGIFWDGIKLNMEIR